MHKSSKIEGSGPPLNNQTQNQKKSIGHLSRKIPINASSNLSFPSYLLLSCPGPFGSLCIHSPVDGFHTCPCPHSHCTSTCAAGACRFCCDTVFTLTPSLPVLTDFCCRRTTSLCMCSSLAGARRGRCHHSLLHLLLSLWCSQTLLSPYSLHLFLSRLCWQMPLPPQSVHVLFTCRCWKRLPLMQSLHCQAGFSPAGARRCRCHRSLRTGWVPDCARIILYPSWVLVHPW